MLVNKWIIWLNDWLSCVALTLRWIEVRWGEVSEWEGESERANEWLWCMGAENDHFVNVRSSLNRMLTTQFDRLEVYLAWNCIEYVFADQLSSAIIHHDLIWDEMRWDEMISSVNLIWTSICVYVVCVPFQLQYAAREYNHSSLSNVWMLLLIGS